MTWPEVISGFGEAGRAVVGLLSSSEVAAAWGRPSTLEGYTVGGLANHLEVAVGRLAAILDEPAPDGPTCRLVDWYAVAAPTGFYEAVRDRHEQRGHGQDQVVAGLAATVDAMATRLPGEDPGRPVPALLGPGAPARLDDDVLTRTVELLVHAGDLGVGTFEPPAGAARQVAGVLADMALERSGPAPVVRVLARSGDLRTFS